MNDKLYISPSSLVFNSFFFFNDTATTEIYTLSLHDALPISAGTTGTEPRNRAISSTQPHSGDRKSTRLNSSHRTISYAVFCLKKKNNEKESVQSNKLKTRDLILNRST